MLAKQRQSLGFLGELNRRSKRPKALTSASPQCAAEGLYRLRGTLHPCHTQPRVRFFNTEGEVILEDHYCIPPLERVDLDEIVTLIERKKYFILHAPRQTGKTSVLAALADYLNATGRFRCVYVNVEPAQSVRQDVGAGINTILAALALEVARTTEGDVVERIWQKILDRDGPLLALKNVLSEWAASGSKPLILFLDEIDALIGDTLVSVLRQLRAGYRDRPRWFPQSVLLCGVRDVRDYRIFSESEGFHITGGSVFNITAQSLRLGDFCQSEVRSLLLQHTDETGQQFEAGAIDHIWNLTQGQPWLVNALAYQACFRDRQGRDRSRPVTVGAIDQAKETLILNHVTHLDQLADKLREERVRRVILPMIAGSPGYDYSGRDLEYVRDLGLVALDDPPRMANPIYAEVIPRELTAVQEGELKDLVSPGWYIQPDGSLDVKALLAGFQDYFREHSESWLERYGHREAGPQLVLHGYLHRVVNSGGRITRQYAIARGRSDLVVEWPRLGRPLSDRPLKHVIECKVVGEKKSLETRISKGLEQTAWYMDCCGAESGHLVVFDLRLNKSWEERVFRRDSQPGAPPITVWGI